MAQLVVQTAAAVIGYYIGGPAGAQIGWTIAPQLGNAVVARSQQPTVVDVRTPDLTAPCLSAHVDS